MLSSKIKYRQPKLVYWVKLTTDIWSEGERLADKDTIHIVRQYIEADTRMTQMPPIRIMSPLNGRLIGIYKHEFEYCNEKGEPSNGEATKVA